MNQFSKFRFINNRTHALGLLAFSIAAVALVLSSSDSLAQQSQNFGPPRDTFTSARLKPPSGSWPTDQVTFDSQVSHAKFESDVAPAESSNGEQSSALQSTLASSGAMFTYLKDNVLAKANGMFGGSSEGAKEGAKPGKLNITKMLSSLAIVLGGYFAFVWIVRKLNPGANSQLPPDVVQVLGQTPFGQRQTLQVVRLGSKLVLLLNGAEGTFPMGEITDPSEVHRLTAMCNHRGGRSRDGSLSSSIGNSLSRHLQSNQPSQAAATQTTASHIDFRQAGSPAQSQAVLSQTVQSQTVQSQSEQVTVGKETLTGLANILRSIDNASKQNRPSVFEA